MNRIDTFVKGVIGGLCIGMGGSAFLCAESTALGTFLFTVGLFVICTMGFNLYTGKVAYVVEKDLPYAMDVIIIWLGNLAGTFVTALLLLMTRQGPAMREKALAMCNVKLSDSLVSAFVLGIFCNFLIFVAVDGYNKNPHEIGKYLSLVFGVMVFIIAGFEHSIADMFYISVAGAWSGRALLFIIVVSLGNAVGGILIPLYRKLAPR